MRRERHVPALAPAAPAQAVPLPLAPAPPRAPPSPRVHRVHSSTLGHAHLCVARRVEPPFARCSIALALAFAAAPLTSSVAHQDPGPSCRCLPQRCLQVARSPAPLTLRRSWRALPSPFAGWPASLHRPQSRSLLRRLRQPRRPRWHPRRVLLRWIPEVARRHTRLCVHPPPSACLRAYPRCALTTPHSHLSPP